MREQALIDTSIFHNNFRCGSDSQPLVCKQNSTPKKIKISPLKTHFYFLGKNEGVAVEKVNKLETMGV
ncbi:MAG: hypothetical protein EA369_04500 [Bradymonadales bacterium]|nr:MAG: hypothetical protein EA369_04500 [Bradymonadales bacterium]